MTQIHRVCPKDDPDTRIYFTRYELTDAIVARERGMCSCNCGLCITASGESLLDVLLTFPGVIAAEVHVYHIVIHRAPVFDWSEIEPHILKIMSSYVLGGSIVDQIAAEE